MRKSDIDLRYTNGRQVPAINVKCHHFGPSCEEVMTHFGCDKETAEQALGFAWETACETFWEQMPAYVAEIFPGAKCCSGGRQNGWLIVTELPEVETWDAVRVAKWAKLVRLAASEIDYLRSDECVFEAIEANEWARPGAELYNFIDAKDGETHCLADLKAAAVAAGFGAIIR